MKDVSFYHAWPDKEALYDYEPTLFHLRDHLILQCASGWNCYYAVNDKNGKIVASLSININGKKGNTAVRSPYGGIECSSGLSAETLYEFIRFIDGHLADTVDEAVIKFPPEAYAPRSQAMSFSFLHALGFTSSNADLSSCITVSGNFVDVLRKTEEQVLNKALEAGLTASVMPGNKLHDAYSFIANHHNRKGYPMSMTWNQLEETTKLFPGRYLAFAVHSKEELIGAAIAVRVSSSVLSLFYIDHDSQADKLSPPVLLIASLYDYCSTNHIPLLDLGTSSLQEGPNISLLSFKMRMGARPSVKPTLRKVYTHG
ncbi:hypothetical protein WBG78_11000 [Chryseolinea sp. T2]|uniref:hypothetical protein n=1 Tax=Chryseolinea sp. T2 TaxID=3129255 RepID=UPI00307785B3